MVALAKRFALGCEAGDTDERRLLRKGKQRGGNHWLFVVCSPILEADEKAVKRDTDARQFSCACHLES
jgi:tRNA A37 threonylcarbamoyladenosine synthetase subunit TsaC/SUA5/YrdC